MMQRSKAPRGVAGLASPRPQQQPTIDGSIEVKPSKSTGLHLRNLRSSQSTKMMHSMTMASMDQLNGMRSDSANLDADKRTVGEHQYADVDTVLSVSLGSLPKLLGLEGLTPTNLHRCWTGSELLSTEDNDHAKSFPPDLVTLSRWRCWLGAYNVDGIKPPENPRNKLKRAASKLIMLKRAGLLGGGTTQIDHDDQESRISFRKGSTLHVRNISGGVLVGNVLETSEYESPEKLEQVFKPFGHVEQVTIRHRIQKGANTSWALVTMKDAAVAHKVMQASRVVAGPHKLKITLFDDELAQASSGEMALIRTRHWIGIQHKTLKFGSMRSNASWGVICWSWFWWCVAVIGLILVALLSWHDALVHYPLTQTYPRTRLPALDVTLTDRYNHTMTMTLTLASDRGLATESNEWNGIIDNDDFRSTRLGGSLLLGPERIVALQFEEALLPPEAHIDQAFLLLEAVGQDNRFLSTAPTPLLSPRFGETHDADYARRAPLKVGISAALDTAVLLRDVLSLSSFVRSRTYQQVPWEIGAEARNQLHPQLVQSADVSSVLQELVDAPGWSRSSAVTLFMEHASGDGQVLYTNSDMSGSIFGPMLMSMLCAAVYLINVLFCSKANKMTVLDVQDSKEVKLESRVRTVVTMLNAVLLLMSLWLICKGANTRRKRTVFYWVRQIYLQLVAAYSVNLFAMWLMHFHVACKHLIFVGTQFWLSMSLQTTRTVEVLMSKLTPDHSCVLRQRLMVKGPPPIYHLCTPTVLWLTVHAIAHIRCRNCPIK